MASHPIETRLFINGEFRPASSGKSFQLTNPFTREPAAEVHEANEQDVNAAVAAAKTAFPAWRDMDPRERGQYLHKMASLIRESTSELAYLETISTGRPISHYFDAAVAADNFDYYAEAGWNAQGTSSLNTRGHLNLTVKQPFGVVGAIIPWNVPLAAFTFKVAPALAAGNTVVLKSSEKAPLTSLYAAKLIEKANFPPGVVNVLSGFGTPAGEAMASHMDIRCVSFTGSSSTGQRIQAAAAKSNMKQVHMELGGKSPAVVFEDADLESAAEQTQFSVRILSGQTCMANSRVYVQESAAEEFINLFKAKFAAGHIGGNPLEASTAHGPQVDEVQYNRVKNYLAIGEKEGTMTLGGDAKNGLFVHPTIFENTSDDARIMQEEIFGPVVAINTFKTEGEVAERANRTEFGLYASVFTKDIDRAVRMSKLLEAGAVGVNCTSPTIANDVAFGGFKMSGTGRDGYLHSLENYLETKTVLIRVSSS
ncbi:Aldehyde dehydrogenase [Aspergillus sp. HF37]|nr:Aldehyde dehydrogenase [Aspergillus sp. HF37]